RTRSGSCPLRTECAPPPPARGSSYITPGGPPRTVGAPAPGAKVFWFGSLSHRGRVLLHPNRDSPTSKPELSPNRRSTRPGCEGALARLPFAPRAVLLHPNRDSPRTVGAPAPGAKGFGPGLRGLVGERCSALITASIEALAIADQHGAEVVIVAGSALDTAGGIKPEF